MFEDRLVKLAGTSASDGAFNSQASQFVADDWEPLTWSGRLTPARVGDYLQALVSRQILAPPGR